LGFVAQTAETGNVTPVIVAVLNSSGKPHPGVCPMAIDFLDGVKAERDEQKRRYLKTFREALTLGKLTDTEQTEFDRLDNQVSTLNETCRQKEIDLEPWRSQNLKNT
jgi:hypothetical protein